MWRSGSASVGLYITEGRKQSLARLNLQLPFNQAVHEDKAEIKYSAINTLNPQALAGASVLVCHLHPKRLRAANTVLLRR